MKFAVISDVHGDIQALQDALGQIDRLRCDLIVCAGDLIDYGVHHEEVIALLIRRGIPTIRGNHDRWAIGRGRLDDPKSDQDEVAVYDASGWGLSRSAFTFLSSLPTRWDSVIEDVRVAVRHGSPKSDMDGLIAEDMITRTGDRRLEEVQADVLIVGHTHVPFAARTPCGGLVCNPGALLRDGEKRDDVPRPGTFGVLELPTREWRVYHSATGREVEIVRGRQA